MQGDPEAAFTGQSLPIRGAWIEIKTATSKQSKTKSLPIRGAWIEISPPNHANTAAAGRSPSGERGLKYPRTVERQHLAGSLPIRGAWIEISLTQTASQIRGGRSPSGERGLKSETYATKSSLTQVAPHPGSVD